jgi:hypothetical protein
VRYFQGDLHSRVGMSEGRTYGAERRLVDIIARHEVECAGEFLIRSDPFDFACLGEEGRRKWLQPPAIFVEDEFTAAALEEDRPKILLQFLQRHARRGLAEGNFLRAEANAGVSGDSIEYRQLT